MFALFMAQPKSPVRLRVSVASRGGGVIVRLSKWFVEGGDSRTSGLSEVVSRMDRDSRGPLDLFSGGYTLSFSPDPPDNDNIPFQLPANILCLNELLPPPMCSFLKVLLVDRQVAFS